MNLENHPQKFITDLTIQQIHKLYPQNYYTKYASHIKLLQSERKLIRNNTEHTQRKYKKHKLLQQLQKPKKIKISLFDRVDDLILKNYDQFYRMSQYAKQLGYKLEQGPRKKTDSIKTTRQNFVELNPQIFNKIKLLQDLAYEKKIQQFKKKKIKSQQVLKFKKNQKLEKNTICSHNKLIPSKYTKSQFFQSPQLSSRYSPSVSQNMLELINKSTLINYQLKQLPNDKKNLSMIMNFNHSMKQFSKVQKTIGHRSNPRFLQLPKNMRNASMILNKRLNAEKNPRDLLSETQQIKKKSASLKIQKRKQNEKYKEHMKRLIKQFQDC